MKPRRRASRIAAISCAWHHAAIAQHFIEFCERAFLVVYALLAGVGFGDFHRIAREEAPDARAQPAAVRIHHAQEFQIPGFIAGFFEQFTSRGGFPRLVRGSMWPRATRAIRDRAPDGIGESAALCRPP